MIDILIPVLGRPHRAAPLVENIRAVTEVDHTIAFLCTHGDTAEIDACVEAGADFVHVVPKNESGDYAKKINEGFHHGEAEWVFQAADDLEFEPGWDLQALKTAGGIYDVVATNDMANGSVKRGLFGTHNLIRRRYITGGRWLPEIPVLHEGYDHNFVDRELCGWAQHHGTFVFARHSHVKHHHPLWRTAPSDPTYVKSLAHFREDQKLFYSRAHLWGYHGLSAHERTMAA